MEFMQGHQVFAGLCMQFSCRGVLQYAPTTDLCRRQLRLLSTNNEDERTSPLRFAQLFEIRTSPIKIGVAPSNEFEGDLCHICSGGLQIAIFRILADQERENLAPTVNKKALPHFCGRAYNAVKSYFII